MCFIKISCTGSRSLLDDCVPPSNNTNGNFGFKTNTNSHTSFDSDQSLDFLQQFYSLQDKQLSQIYASIAMNSNLLLKLQEGICNSQNALEQAFEAIQSQSKQILQVKMETEQTQKTSDPIVQKLFGVSSYRYRLRLKHRFPSVIYKERNMFLSVQLVDLQGKIVLNSNLINLCLGVCDVNGQWISQNQEGNSFLKGKTEVELYHGQVSFQKIWPRDVSRSYPKGKINLVIHSEPSLIKFSSMSSCVEELVNASLIEPLIINDVTIRAKKKSSY